MSFHHLDRYADIPSPFTKLAPVARLLGTVGIALGGATLPLGAWVQMGALIALVIVLAGVARIPAFAFSVRIAGPLALVLFVSVGLLFLVPGEVLWSLGPFRVSDAGLLRFGSVLGRSAPALGAAVILVSTLRFTDLLEALRRLRLPHDVIIALGLAYRFLYILTDEIERLGRAARSRNAGRGAASRRRLMMGIAAASLSRTFSRSERVHQAMLARGYQGVLPSLHTRELDFRSAAALTTLCATVLIITLSAHL